MDELENDQRAGVHKALNRWKRNYELKELQIRDHQDKMRLTGHLSRLLTPSSQVSTKLEEDR